MDFGSKCRFGVCFLHLICFCFYVYLSLLFSACFHWWVCLLVWSFSSFFLIFFCDCVCVYFFVWFCLFSFAFTSCFEVLSVHFFLFSSFSSVPCGWQGLHVPASSRPEPLSWESQIKDIRPSEIFRPHVILINKSSPRDLHLTTKTQVHPMASKLQCWMPHAKQLARQEHYSTH